MTRSRVPDLLDHWRRVAQSAVLPAQAPKPARKDLGPGIGIIVAAIAVSAIAIWARPNNSLPSDSAGVGFASTGLPSQSGPTPGVPATDGVPTGAASMTNDGTCSASQLALGTPTSYGLNSVLGRVATALSQPIRNTGGGCLLKLPSTIEVAQTTGEFISAQVDTGSSTPSTIYLEQGEAASIEFQATWYLDGFPLGRTTEPCAASISDVTRVELILGSGTLDIGLETAWSAVCTAPPNVSMSTKSKQ